MTTKTTYTETYVLQVKDGDNWVDEYSAHSLNFIEDYKIIQEFTEKSGISIVTRIIKRTEINDISEEVVG